MSGRDRRQALWAYVLFAAIGGALALVLWSEVDGVRGPESVSWRDPWALVLLGGAALVFWVGVHLRRYRVPTLWFSRVTDASATRPGWVARTVSLPVVLRAVAVALLAVALARPQTYRVEDLEVEGIDIMIVLDLSKSMEERDLRRNRLDAGQRTIREFLTRRESDRVGLVGFARVAVLQCPLTLDYSSLDRIVSELAIGDVPAMGTAIGDALGLALASLRRSEAESKVVILVSDGDSNVARKMDPLEAKSVAEDMGVKVFTILMGTERRARGLDGSGRYDVNPELLKQIAADTGGAFFRAGDDEALESSFREVRQTLDKTRRRVTGRIPNAELFGLFAWPGAILVLLEIALRLTRWRRFP